MTSERGGSGQLPDPVREIPTPRTYIHDTEPTPGIRTFYLGEGESPFGPPPQYREIRRRLEEEGVFAEAGEHYKSTGVEQGIQNIREMNGLSEAPYVVFSAGGSDEILERSMWLLKQLQTPRSPKTRILGYGPHFPNIVNFARRFEEFKTDISYGPLDIPLGSDYQYAIDKAIQHRRIYSSSINYVHYICNPSTPKGEIMNPQDLERLLDATSRDLVIVDQAFGGILLPNESAMKYTETNPNLIVLESLSKSDGIPGERIGFAVMSPEIGKNYERLRREYDIPGPTKQLINMVTDPEIRAPHLNMVREKTKEVKSTLLEEFRKRGIRVLPTSNRTPICLIDGVNEGFIGRLQSVGIDATPAVGFGETVYPEGILSNRYARLTIPANVDDVPEIADRISEAIAA